MAHPIDKDVFCCKSKPCYGEHWSVRGNTYWEGRPLPDKTRAIDSIVDRIKNKR